MPVMHITLWRYHLHKWDFITAGMIDFRIACISIQLGKNTLMFINKPFFTQS